MGSNLKSLNQYLMTVKKMEQTKEGPMEKQVITVNDINDYKVL